MMIPRWEVRAFHIAHEIAAGERGIVDKATVAAIVSPRLCGGMFVAIPTAMPELPLTSRFREAAGKVRWGSSRLSS